MEPGGLPAEAEQHAEDVGEAERRDEPALRGQIREVGAESQVAGPARTSAAASAPISFARQRPERRSTGNRMGAEALMAIAVTSAAAEAAARRSAGAMRRTRSLTVRAADRSGAGCARGGARHARRARYTATITSSIIRASLWSAPRPHTRTSGLSPTSTIAARPAARGAPRSATRARAWRGWRAR